MRDWVLKREALLGAFSKQTYKELFLYVYSQAYPGSPKIEQMSFAEQIAGANRHWKNGSTAKCSDEAGPGRFWKALSKVLDDENAIPVNLMRCSIAEFISYLPDGLKEDAVTALEYKKSKLGVNSVLLSSLKQKYATQTCIVSALTNSGDEYYSHLIPYSHEPQSIEEGIAVGVLNQAHYYLSLDASKAWIDLIESEGYPIYIHCLDALQTLVKRPTWLNHIGSSHYKTLICLGAGGAVSKDLVLIESMIKPNLQEPIEYIIQEISPFLASKSRVELHRVLERKNLLDKVNLSSNISDFLKLSENPVIPHSSENGCAIWTLLGCTIGNIDESSLLSGVNTKASRDDLFVVSTDTFDEKEGIREFRKRVTENYESQSMQDFLLPVVRVVQTYCGIHAPISDILENVEISVVEGCDRNLTGIPNSRTVLFTLQVEGKEIILLTSTRYEKSSLVRYFDQQGWLLADCAESELQRNYLQFLFKRK